MAAQRLDASCWSAGRLPALRFLRSPRCASDGYAPGVTTSTACGIIFPAIRSHEILMFVTCPASTRTEAERIEDLKGPAEQR